LNHTRPRLCFGEASPQNTPAVRAILTKRPPYRNEFSFLLAAISAIFKTTSKLSSGTTGLGL